jgi:hypothetical protein
LEGFLGGACKPFWNVLLRKDTQVWENDVLMIIGLQAYKTTGDALKSSKESTETVSLLKTGNEVVEVG